jgi:hypothetical protein
MEEIDELDPKVERLRLETMKKIKARCRPAQRDSTSTCHLTHNHPSFSLVSMGDSHFPPKYRFPAPRRPPQTKPECALSRLDCKLLTTGGRPSAGETGPPAARRLLGGDCMGQEAPRPADRTGPRRRGGRRRRLRYGPLVRRRQSSQTVRKRGLLDTLLSGSVAAIACLILTCCSWKAAQG